MHTASRLTALDLRNLSEEEHAALRQEAIRLGLSLPEYLSKLIVDTSAKLVGRKQSTFKQRAAA